MTSGKDISVLEKTIRDITHDIYGEINHAANHNASESFDERQWL
jgi:hypothetical protein